jgi:hypothetical protein
MKRKDNEDGTADLSFEDFAEAASFFCGERLAGMLSLKYDRIYCDASDSENFACPYASSDGHFVEYPLDGKSTQLRQLRKCRISRLKKKSWLKLYNRRERI